MPTYRVNPENTTQGKSGTIGQEQFEDATYEGGIIHHSGDGVTRVIAKGEQTGAQRTMNAGSTLRNNAGVIMPMSDKMGLDPYPGKSGGTKIDDTDSY